MSKTRFLFEKTGTARYISHLDLMRTVKRAFTRAGFALRHSEGFNPHPLMVFALPLSVGQESVCELLDVEFVGDLPENPLKSLNAALPDGLRVTEIYASERKFAKIRWLQIEGCLHYDNGVPDGAVARLTEVFGADSLVIHKKTKRGETNYDIKNDIIGITFSDYNDKIITVSATISAQNPTLNPSAITEVLAGVERLAPDFSEFRRTELYDEEMQVFR
ncbi:MAG: TIGR03936 family radical SAM-associated protein [Oscillospiraceae bacterium]|jgi:radical SAM-linked protein|nr:TIGR03936 family radical SAM-associated protein [Oscillospiraceae bacterium]